MSLMTKRSFRHWQKSSKKSISKITKRHTVVIVMVIIIATASLANRLAPEKKENSSRLYIFYNNCSIIENLRKK